MNGFLRIAAGLTLISGTVLAPGIQLSSDVQDEANWKNDLQVAPMTAMTTTASSGR